MSDLILTVSTFCKSQILYECPTIEAKKIRTLFKPTVSIANNIRQLPLPFKKQFKINQNFHIITTITAFRYYRKSDAVLHYHEPVIDFLSSHPDWCWIIAGDGKQLKHVKQIILYTACKSGIEKQIFEEPYSLINILDEFVESDITRKNIGTANQKFAVQYYDPVVISKKFINILNEL
ncbi:MAG: hypothetical protein L3J69_08600 [Desulfobacula sp.]|nr:hypothetical protein [Desulfobacula sp.]